MDRSDVAVVLTTVAALLLTCSLRVLPLVGEQPPPGFEAVAYTDFYTLYWRMVFEAIERVKAVQNAGGVLDAVSNTPVPFRDYFMEYPPVAAGLIYVASVLNSITYALPPRTPPPISIPFSLALVATSYVSTYLVMRRALVRLGLSIPLLSLLFVVLLDPPPATYFFVIAVVRAFLLAVAQTTIIELGRNLNVSRYVVLYASISPSLLLFAVYNFDVMMLALTLLGLHYTLFRRGGERVGLALLGVSVATKLVSAPALLTMLFRMSRSVRDFIKKGIHAGLAPAAMFLAVMAVSTQGFANMVTYLSTFFCENCLWLPLVGGDPFNPFNRYLFYGSLLITVALGLKASKQASNEEQMLKVFTWVLTGTVIFNYVFPPQFVIEVIPLLALTIPTQLAPALITADVVNVVAGIKCLETAPACFYWGTLPQTLFAVRNALLLFIYLTYFVHIVKPEARVG